LCGGSGNKEEFAGGAAGLEVALRLCCVREWVDVLDAELEGAVGDCVEDSFGAGFEFGAGGDVVLERGAGDEEGAHGGEADEIEGRDGSAGSAEECEEAAGAQALERLLEGGLANGVVYDCEALVVGQGFDLRGEVLLGVEDDLVCPGGAGEGGFLFGGDCGEDAGAEGLRHLDEEEAGASCACVDEDLVAMLDCVGGVEEIVGGHALEDGGGGLLRGDAFGDGYEAGGWCHGELGVGAGDEAPGYAVAGFEGGDVGCDGDDGAGGLLAEGVGEFCGVAALAEVGVDEVDAGGFDADEGFAWAGGWRGEVGEGEDVGGAGGVDLDGVHGWLSGYNMGTNTRLREALGVTSSSKLEISDSRRCCAPVSAVVTVGRVLSRTL
jgi:hypothetical protein